MGSSPLQPWQRRGARLAAVATVALLVASTFALGCGDDNDEPARFSVRAAVVEPGAPVVVEATAIRNAGGGLLGHEVRVTWRGEGEAVLDDARFTHHARGREGGDRVIAGRGCGADWDAERRWSCTRALPASRLSALARAQPTPTRSASTPKWGRCGSIEPGRMPSRKSFAGGAAAEGPATLPEGDPAGQFTIRLTYGPR